MTPAQKSALEALISPPAPQAPVALTAEQIEQIDPLLDPNNRNDVAIAAILSAGRTRPVPTEIGIGTVLAKLGEGGGAFLDALERVGQQDANVKWSMVLIRDGRFRIDMTESRAAMQALANQISYYELRLPEPFVALSFHLLSDDVHTELKVVPDVDEDSAPCAASTQRFL